MRLERRRRAKAIPEAYDADTAKIASSQRSYIAQVREDAREVTGYPTGKHSTIMNKTANAHTPHAIGRLQLLNVHSALPSPDSASLSHTRYSAIGAK